MTLQVNTVNTILNEKWNQTADRDRLLVAYVGDAHLLRPEEDRPRVLEQFPSAEWAHQRLEPVFRELMSLAVRPRLLILGGDMTDTAEPGEWQRVFDLIELVDIPWLLTLGNHDHERAIDCPGFKKSHQALRSYGLHASVVDDFWCHEADVAGYHFVFLDSLETGDLGSEQHEFLRNALAKPVPTVISCHRPVVEVGNWMDEHRLFDETYVKIVSEAQEVVAVLSGHTHKSGTAFFANSWHLVSPAVCYGIGDRTGYRLICLAEGRLAWTALRMMPGPSVHEVNAPVVDQVGAFEVHDFKAD